MATPASSFPTIPGERLRALHRQRGMSLRDIHEATVSIAKQHDSFEYVVSRSALAEIETLGRVPTLYHLQALAEVYEVSIQELLSWFGIETSREA